MVGKGVAESIAMAVATALAKKAATEIAKNKTVRRGVSKGVKAVRRFTGLGYAARGKGIHLGGGGVMLAGQRDMSGRFVSGPKKVIRTRIL